MTKEKNTTASYIEKTIRLLGLNSSYKGYNFLIYAVSLAINNPEILTYICKGLYYEIALYYGTTITCAERNLRTAKEIIWEKGNKELLGHIFAGYHSLTPPSNAVFIDMLAFYIQNTLDVENSAKQKVGNP